MELRPIDPADYEACANTLSAAFAAPPWNETWDRARALKRFEGFMSSVNSRGWVAVEGGDVAGYCIGHINFECDFEELWVDEFCVNPAFQRRGVGSALMTYVRAQLETNDDVEDIVLTTERGSAAEAFYEANGLRAKNDIVMMAG